MKRTVFVLLAAAIAAGVPVDAHHSFAADYFESQSMTVRGELVEFEYRSPHAWVHIMAPDKSGQMRRYSAEWANPNRLGQQGITKTTLKPGDQVIITGAPGRTENYRLHLKSVERPADGWTWSGRR